MYAGPFPGFNLNIDMSALRVVSIVHDGQPDFSVSIQVPGGSTQECVSTGGTNLQVNAVVRIDPPLEVDNLTWRLDGQDVAYGESAVLFVPLGTHTIEAILASTTGDLTSAGSTVVIEDTVAPGIHAAFTAPRTDEPISELAGPGLKRAGVSIDVHDACDPAPTSTATAGLAVSDNDRVTTLSPPGGPAAHLILDTRSNSVELSVSAQDASGNVSSVVRTLSVTP
jgi:hypothetical protein